MTRRSIPAVYMRAAARKGVFFQGRDLPRDADVRDALLLRATGSPDPFAVHADGMGGGTPASSNVAVITPSRQDDCDIDCLFGTVAVDRPEIDWTGDGVDLAAAAGPFAIFEGLVPPAEGMTRVRMLQPNTGRRIDAFVPVRDGEVVEAGPFVEDGVPFASSEVRLEYLDPAGHADGASDALLPTANPQDMLDAGEAGRIAVTMLSALRPTVFVRAEALGLTGRESAAKIDRDRKLLERLEAIRAAAAVRMGLAETVADAMRNRPDAPQICWVARPAAYRTSKGVEVGADRIDLLARSLERGRLSQACTGTGSIGLAVAAALPGSVVAEVARTLPGVPTRIGHASGTLAIGAEVSWRSGRWHADKAVLSHGARRLMSGTVHVPGAGLSSRA